MNLRLLCCLAVLLLSAAAHAQDLSFIGLKDVKFGMTIENLKNKQVVMDTSTAYKDTATYIRNTRCIIWQKKDQDMKLGEFTASKVEYEFCDKHLFYVFITVSGTDNVSKALHVIQSGFPKAGCGKGTPLGNCTSFDSKNKKYRIIATQQAGGQELSLVIIPKKLKY